MEKFGLNMTFREYVADGFVHAFGVALTLIGAMAMVYWVAHNAPANHIAPVVTYLVGLIASFSISASYNMCLHRNIRPVLRRFDHAAIFVLIAGTYTPLALIGIGGMTGIALAAAAWMIAGLGVVMKLFMFHRFRRFTFILFLINGWLAIIAVGEMIRALPFLAFALLLGGGLIYTLGTIIYHRDNWLYNRAIWHVMVVAAAAIHYAAIFTVVAA